MTPINIAKTHDIEPGTGKAFELGSLCIAIFNVNGNFYALNDTCPHRGASLAQDYLS